MVVYFLGFLATACCMSLLCRSLLLINWTMLGTECTQLCSSLCHYPYSAALSVSCPNTRVVWTVLGLSMKTRMYISKLFLFFNIIALKTNTFIPAMLQRHYPVPVVVLRKICNIPLYSCSRLLIRRKTLNSVEEFEFGEEREVRGSQIWGTGWMFQQFIVQIP